MKKITNESLFELKSVSQPIILKNHAFYIETRMDEKENKYFSSIYRMDLDTKERVLFSDLESSNTSLQITPDERKLSFLSNNTKDNKMQLFTIPLTGGTAKQRTFEKDGISNYFWLADGQTVYYQTNIQSETEEITEEMQDFPKKKEITKLNYKMDGRGVIPEDRSYQIKKMSLNHEESEVVIEAERPLSLGYVAKDESYILYFDRLDPEDEWVYGGSMYKYDLLTGQSKLLTQEIPKGSFQFSLANKNEDYFLFIGNDFEYKFVTNNAVYGYDVENETLMNLTGTLDYGVGDSLVGDFQQNLDAKNIWWLEDGKDFLFKTTERGKITLYRGAVDGTVEKVFDKNVHITGLDLSEDKQTAVITYSTLTQPSVVALLDLKTSTITDLYNPNEFFFQEYAVSNPERFWFKSIKNWDIQGWYVPPIEVSTPHPAILYIHGGPQVSYGETFFHEMQALAAQGYGVIMLNPRGGSGYGQDFVASILNNYGDEDYQDLMNGLDFVLDQHPEINREALYVAGGSYGGFMTNWIVTHTNRFRAAVTQRSISNWISFYGASDIGPAFVEFQLGRDLRHADELWKMSPLAYAEKTKTPLLILHGEEDLRCPLEQGQQMYIAMKKHGVATRFVTFPESSHGLSREGLPNLRLERLQEINNWFEIY